MGQGGLWETWPWGEAPLFKDGWGVIWNFVSSESPLWCGGLTQKEREKENSVSPPGFHESWAWPGRGWAG